MKRSGAGSLALALAGGVGLLPAFVSRPASAQTKTELITTALPYPAYESVQDDHYGNRIGRLRLRYDLSLEAAYTDNRNYSSRTGDGDFMLRPLLTVGLFYPIAEFQKLQLDVGVGYEWWAEADARSRFVFTVAPNSHLTYQARLGEVLLTFANHTSSSSEASSRAEYAGGSSPGTVDFRRLLNDTSVKASWALSRRISLNGGYSFILDRSMNDQFQSLDRNAHAFFVNPMVQITAPIAAGISASYSMFSFERSVQNDGESFSVGPRVEWRISSSLQASAGAGYTVTTFERGGSVGDSSDASAPTYDVSIRHELGRRLGHDVIVSRRIDTGFGSNYTDLFTARYSIRARFSDRLTSNFALTYEQANQSGVHGDTGDLYAIELGAGYRLLRQLQLGLTYSHFERVGETADRGYSENRVTLRGSYTF